MHKDKNWIAIKSMLEKKGIEFEGFTSIYEDGEDQLKTIIEALQQEDEEEPEEEEEPRNTPDAILDRLIKEVAGHIEEEKPDRKPRKPKKLAPEVIFVFDDLSNELKSASLTSLLKKNRHFKCKVVVSSQYLCDLAPESRKQMDIWLIFKGQPLEKLKEIYKDADIALPMNLFLYLYKTATSKPYSFMYIDTRNDKYRIGFNKEFVLPDLDSDF